MSFLILPNFPQNGRHEYQSPIGGSDYVLEFTFDERLQRWYVEIRTASGVVIETGVRVVVDYPLFIRSRLEALPDGRFLVVDVSGASREIEAQLELGERVQLVFIPTADLDPAPEAEGLIIKVITPP